MLKMHLYNFPHSYTIWKILIKFDRRGPIVNEYNLDINTCIYVGGHYFKSFESEYENILTDNLSLIKLLEYKWFLFTVEFKNLYSYISEKYSLGLMKRWL